MVFQSEYETCCWSPEYSAHEEEDCRESYVKQCYISFSPVVHHSQVEVCRETLARNCSVQVRGWRGA